MCKAAITTISICALPLLLAACVSGGYDGGGYQPEAPYRAPPPPAVYAPPPPPARYSPPPQAYTPPANPAPQRQKRKVLRSANLDGYCRHRGYSGAGQNRSGTPICVQTKMGFNTTYVAKTSGINYADMCSRQHRTNQYQVHHGRVDCVLFVD